jgi:hypothetical protein
MKLDIEKFLFAYQQGEGISLNDHQRSGLNDLLGFIDSDDLVTDPRHAAYMLATVRHECANTWLPIAEHGKGQGRKYGSPDPVTGQTYYGRGYVQLTWRDNYAMFTKITGADLLRNPDLAMRPDIAYRIMSHGMRKGTFTGVSLGTFIYDDHRDYHNARKIINGTDCAERIAGYAVVFEQVLREAAE